MIWSFCNILSEFEQKRRNAAAHEHAKLYLKHLKNSWETTERQTILPSSEASPSSFPFQRRQEALRRTMRTSPPLNWQFGFWEGWKLWFQQDPWRLGVLTNSWLTKNSELHRLELMEAATTSEGERRNEKLNEREDQAAKLNYAY